MTQMGAVQDISRRWETTIFRIRIGNTILTDGLLMDMSHHPFCAACFAVFKMFCTCKSSVPVLGTSNISIS